MHKNQKKVLFGYQLSFNRTGEPKNWELVEPSFNSRYEAQEYAARHYPNVKAFKIQAVRFDCRPLETPKSGDLK